MTYAARALQSHDLLGEGIKLWITYILFWPHKDMEGLPGWVISPVPGPPPNSTNMKDNTHQAHTQSSQQGEYGMMITKAKWYSGSLGVPQVSWHLSYRWGKTPKKAHPGNLSRPGIAERFQAFKMSLYITQIDIVIQLKGWEWYNPKPEKRKFSGENFECLKLNVCHHVCGHLLSIVPSCNILLVTYYYL